MGEWRNIELGNAVDRLIDYRGKSPPKSPIGTPVISAKVVKAGRIVQPIEQTIDPSYYPVWMTRGLPDAGDVVMTTEGPLGEVAQLDEETAKFALGQRIVSMRGRKGVLDNTFLKFLLMSPNQQEILHSYATGTTVAGISQKALRTVPLSLPPIDAQINIGKLLGALDDKIDLNRRMNETLEAMARATFKDWFVDFGPTCAKAEGHESYLTPEIWDLFPDALDDEDKPMGWQPSKIEDYLELAYGKSLPAKTRRPGRVTVYGSGGLAGFHDEALIDGPAVIVGRKGTVGSLHWEDRPVFPIDTVFYVMPKRSTLLFCYQLLLAQPLADMNTDAAVPGLNRGNAYRLEFPWPGSGLTDAFEALAAPLWKQRSANLRESETLAATRDLLLPKLMSGEIRLREAEKTVETLT